MSVPRAAVKIIVYRDAAIDSCIANCYDVLMKEIRFRRAADQALQRMQPKRRAAILDKLRAYARGEVVDIKKMKGQPFFRIRVGGDRVIIDDDGTVVMVIDAGPRGSIYKE